MPAYSFQKRFVPGVETGEKTHTIRGKRKNRPRPGQKFYGYFGMRTKQCRKLIQSVITSVQDITIEEFERRVVYRDGAHTFFDYPQIIVDGEVLADDEMESLARRDGFADLFAMMQFWPVDVRPFDGDLIHWKFPGVKP